MKWVFKLLWFRSLACFTFSTASSLNSTLSTYTISSLTYYYRLIFSHEVFPRPGALGVFLEVVTANSGIEFPIGLLNRMAEASSYTDQTEHQDYHKFLETSHSRWE